MKDKPYNNDKDHLNIVTIKDKSFFCMSRYTKIIKAKRNSRSPRVCIFLEQWEFGALSIDLQNIWAAGLMAFQSNGTFFWTVGISE